MANVTMLGLRKAFANTEILHGIDLEVQEGEFVVLVGPSGCGKSTLLRCIAGLEDITSGDLYIGSHKVNDVPPAKRGIAMVFQSYALYPHMTVAENMAFGLRLAGMGRKEIDEAVARAAQILQIEHLLERKPKALSGGQRQRVAIGRAIVRKPGVFLFDEPLSNLDAALRVQMRVELARLHRELNTTMVYVTHDQVEAMTLAHRIVVLNAGRVEQVGSPLELYKQPRNLFVAGFIGSPTMNFVAAKLVNADTQGARVRLGNGTEITVAVAAQHLSPGTDVTVGIRPEHLGLVDDAPAVVETFKATVVAVEHLGDTTYVHLTLPTGETWMARTDADHSPLRGAPTALNVPPNKAHLFDAQGLALPRLTTTTH